MCMEWDNNTIQLLFSKYSGVMLLNHVFILKHTSFGDWAKISLNLISNLLHTLNKFFCTVVFYYFDDKFLIRSKKTTHNYDILKGSSFNIKILFFFHSFNIRVWYIHKTIFQREWVSINIQWWTHYINRGWKKGKNVWSRWKRKLHVFFSI